MSELELSALEYHMTRLKAVEMLEKAMQGEISLTHEGWHDVTLAATGSKREAEDAFKASVKAENIRKTEASQET